MSQRLVLTISDEQYKWLEEIKKKKGMKKVQDAARQVLTDMYEKRKEVRK